MRRIIHIIGLIIFVFTMAGELPVYAQSPTPNDSEKFTGEVLCLPGVYLTQPDSCLPAGPSTVLTQMAKDGMVFPAPPLPVSKPSVALNEIPYHVCQNNQSECAVVPFPSAGGCPRGTILPGRGNPLYFLFLW